MDSSHSFGLIFAKIAGWLAHPKFMSIMEGRLLRLNQTAAGYEKTGVPLIGFDGASLRPGEKGDDVGLYWVVPQLARMFHLAPTAAAHLFLSLIVLGCFVAGLFGWAHLTPNPKDRLKIFFSSTLMLALTWIFWDVYVVLFAAAMVGIPWAMILVKSPLPVRTLAFRTIVLGVTLGFFNLIRNLSGFSILIFFLSALWLTRWKEVSRCQVLSGVMILGFLAPLFVLEPDLSRRDAYLAAAPSPVLLTKTGHPFWHQIYIGLGFLPNEHGIVYDDRSAIEKVKEISPDTPLWSRSYEKILREQVFVLVRADPAFVLETVAVKTAMLLIYFLIFANVGILRAARSAMAWPWQIAFFLALAVHAAIGLLVIPHPKYLLGFFTIASFWGTVVPNWNPQPRENL